MNDISSDTIDHQADGSDRAASPTGTQCLDEIRTGGGIAQVFSRQSQFLPCESVLDIERSNGS
jgi:hypothetical protein